MAGKARAADDSGTPEDQADAIWEHLPEEQCSAARANVDVYLDDFISFFQEVPMERRQIIWHLFHHINRVFRPNKESDTYRKDSISQKKLGQGDGARSTRKKVLGWDLNMFSHLLRLPPRQQEKVEAALAAITRKAHSTSLPKWRKLLGLLLSITLAVSGSRGMFTQVQHTLKRATGRHVQLISDVQNDLKAWCKLVCSLASQPTHLRKLQPSPPHGLGLPIHRGPEW